MSTKLIPFESNSALPAFLQSAEPGNLAAFASGGGFDTLSIKGKVFHLNKNGEKILLTKPESEDGEPASSIEVVIIDIGPRGKLSSRIFYAEKYVEGSVEQPDCSSNDGVTPDADVKSPQAKKCAVCPNNVKGSGATQSNPQGKACSSSKRLSIATPDNLSEPMLLRVPGASIVPLGDFLTVLKNRGVPNSYGVVTKIGFDYTVAHPALTFKPVGFVNAAQYAEAAEVASSELSQRIIGIEPAGVSVPAIAAPAEEVEPEVEAPAPAAKPAPKPAAKPAAAKPAAKPAPKPEPVDEVSNVEDGMSASLDDLDFDD